MSNLIDANAFDWGRRIQEGMQQSQDNLRQNAMLDLDKRRVAAYESQLASTEANRLREMTEAQRRESIGRRALMKDPTLLPELFPGFQADPNDPEDAQHAEYIYSQLAREYGGFEPPQQKSVGQLYKMADGTYAPAESAIGGQFYNEPAAPRDGPAPSYRDIIDPADPSRLITVDGRLYRGGSLGSPGVLGIAGKEPAAAKAAETRGTGKNSVTDLVTTLRDSYRQLHKGGGIVDPNAGAISNIGNRIQSSSVGQFVGGAVGTQNQSIRNQIKQSRPLLLQAIRQATGMTGKQMDSNVELQLYLSAATDPELDISANLEALDNIDRLYGLGGDQSGSQPVAKGKRKAPEGIDQAVWDAMTPEEQALWP